MRGQAQHGVLPDETHDEAARADFVTSFKVHVLTDLGPGNKRAFDSRGKMAFQKVHGHAPKSPRDVSRVMRKDPFWQTWSSLNRSGQELMWECLGERAGRQRDNLKKRAKLTAARKTKGSLRLTQRSRSPAITAKYTFTASPVAIT